MKKYQLNMLLHVRFLAFLFILTGSATVMAQTTDQAMILQKCVDLSQLQQYYPKNASNQVLPLVIMQHGVSFPTNIAVTHSGHALVFKNKGTIAGTSAYFLFWTLNIEGANAKVEFVYNYDNNTTPNTKKVTLELEKTGGNWNITNTIIQ